MPFDSGAKTVFLAALPYVNAAGKAKHDVSNHCSGVCDAVALASHTAFGRCAGPDPMLAR